MRKLLIVMSVILLVSCNQPKDEKIIEDVQARITDMLKINYGGCENWRSLQGSKDPSMRAMFLRNCDSRINPENIMFSEMKVYHHKQFVVVCGIVSGRTDVSRQGMRFVQFWDRDDWAYMHSKYSGTKVNGEPEHYWRYHREYCHYN